jgi:hypothetical protein
MNHFQPPREMIWPTIKLDLRPAQKEQAAWRFIYGSSAASVWVPAFCAKIRVDGRKFRNGRRNDRHSKGRKGGRYSRLVPKFLAFFSLGQYDLACDFEASAG